MSSYVRHKIHSPANTQRSGAQNAPVVLRVSVGFDGRTGYEMDTFFLGKKKKGLYFNMLAPHFKWHLSEEAARDTEVERSERKAWKTGAK